MSVWGVLEIAQIAPDPARIVRLVTGEPEAAGVEGWRIAAIAIGIVAAALAATIGWRRVRDGGVDPAEAAFRALARRMRVSAGAKALLRRAAEARGCAPVALLVSRKALADAVAALGEAGARGAGTPASDAIPAPASAA
jgi:hypothetical protein